MTQEISSIYMQVQSTKQQKYNLPALLQTILTQINKLSLTNGGEYIQIQLNLYENNIMEHKQNTPKSVFTCRYRNLA